MVLSRKIDAGCDLRFGGLFRDLVFVQGWLLEKGTARYVRRLSTWHHARCRGPQLMMNRGIAMKKGEV